MTVEASAKAPVNARWKECLPAFARTFRKPYCDAFLSPLIPLRYEGTTLVLGAPSAWLRDYVLRRFGSRIEEILGGPIKIELSDIARKAAVARRHEERAPG